MCLYLELFFIFFFNPLVCFKFFNQASDDCSLLLFLPQIGKHRSSFRFPTLLSWPSISNCVFKGQRSSMPSATSIYSHNRNCFSIDSKLKQQRKRCGTSFATATSAYEFQLAIEYVRAFPDRLLFNAELHHPSRCRSSKVATKSRSPCRFPMGLEFNAE